MRDGFIKIAAGTPKIRVADCRYNAEQIFNLMREAHRQGVRVLALPELCLTGYTCGDLFLQNTLLRGAEEGLATILEATKNLDMLTALGLPVHYRGKLYNCAAILCRGEILGLAPKIHLPNYGEFYEGRWFTSGAALGDTDCCISFAGQDAVEFSTGLVFRCAEMPALTVGVEICEDLWAVNPPSARLCAEGATVMLNLSASNEVVGKSLRPAGVRVRLRQRRGGGVHHRSGVLRPQPHCGKRNPAGRAALCLRADHLGTRCGAAVL